MTAILFTTSCESLPGDTGLDVLPLDDQIRLVSTDSSEVILETQVLDSVATGNAERQLFGNYVDPVFGRISATTFTQVFPGEDLSFGDSSLLRVDSLILTLTLFNVYGKIESPVQLEIFEIKEGFPPVDRLFSNRPLEIYPENLCPFRNCQIDFGNPAAVKDIRVRLSLNLARKLLFAPESALSDLGEFQKFFKGLAIRTKPVEILSREPGAIFELFANASSTDLKLHYSRRPAPNEKYEPQVETFQINQLNDSKKYHTIERSEMTNKLLGASLSSGSDVYQFLQAGGLITLFGKFPNIPNISTLGVNKAELVIKVDTNFLGSKVGDVRRFFPPGQVKMFFIDDQGNENTPVVSELGRLRPNYDAEEGTYVFGMTPYIQRLMRGRENNNGFVIRPSIEGTQVHRAVIGGTNHPTIPPVLKLVYTAPKN